MREKHAYVTFGTLSKAVGQEWKRQNGKILCAMVEHIVGEGASAQLVSAGCKQAAAVIEGHRAILEEQGYTQFPTVSVKKNKAAVEAEVL